MLNFQLNILNIKVTLNILRSSVQKSFNAILGFLAVNKKNPLVFGTTPKYGPDVICFEVYV